MKYSILILFLILASAAWAQQTKLALASDIWPPFTDDDNKQAIALDLVKEALNRTGIKTSVEFLDFADVLRGLSEKKYDGCAALWATDQRKETLMYSVPYLQNRLVLVGRKGFDVSARSLASLAGKRIAVVENFAYDLPTEVAKSLTFVYGKNNQETLNLLLNERADYMLIDALIIQFLITYQQEDVSKYLEVGTNGLVNRTLHFAIRRDFPQAEQIIAQFNQEIAKMVTDGSYNEILQLKWIQVDVDGDGLTEFVLNGTQAGSRAPFDIYNILLDNTGSVMANSGTRYYIAGTIYADWNNIPEEYKVPAGNVDSHNVRLLSFRLNKKQ